MQFLKCFCHFNKSKFFFFIFIQSDLVHYMFIFSHLLQTSPTLQNLLESIFFIKRRYRRQRYYKKSWTISTPKSYLDKHTLIKIGQYTFFNALHTGSCFIHCYCHLLMSKGLKLYIDSLHTYKIFILFCNKINGLLLLIQNNF